jgi:hypothetical protein
MGIWLRRQQQRSGGSRRPKMRKMPQHGMVAHEGLKGGEVAVIREHDFETALACAIKKL